MRMNMAIRRAVTEELAGKYRGSWSREQRGEILDEVVELTRYNRHYAAWLLRNIGKCRVIRTEEGELVRVVVGRANRRRGTPRPREYDEKVQRLLKLLWDAFGLCSRRLKAAMPDLLPSLVRRKEVKEEDPEYRKLLRVSPATIDRLLRPERAGRGNSHTKPSSLLKAQIPVLTSSELDTTEPGHYQIDLVGHDGGNPNGQFAFTLTVVDLYSGWVEPRILPNKAQSWTKKALMQLSTQLPVRMKGIHSDNDSPFINEELQKWCVSQGIHYSRARPYRSNDTCWVEQKNYDIVRQMVGYYRYDTEEEIALISQLYQCLSPLVNYFYPSAKLVEKTRVAGRIHRRYDAPLCPFRRLLAFEHLPKPARVKLWHLRHELDPFTLKLQITDIQQQLLQIATRKGIKVLHPGPRTPTRHGGCLSSYSGRQAREPGPGYPPSYPQVAGRRVSGDPPPAPCG